MRKKTLKAKADCTVLPAIENCEDILVFHYTIRNLHVRRS